MKKLILLLLITSSLPFIASAQKDINRVKVSLRGFIGTNLIKSNDTLKIDFEPTKYFWNLKIDNKLKKDISIVWDKSSFIQNGSSSKMAFDNTISILINDPKQDDLIPKESYINKSVIPANNVGTNFIPTVSKIYVKSYNKENNKDWVTKIILAVKIDDVIYNYEYVFDLVAI